MYVALAALAVLVAFYCFLGVVMNIQFAAATENAGYARIALLWGRGAWLSRAGAVALARTAWKQRRRTKGRSGVSWVLKIHYEDDRGLPSCGHRTTTRRSIVSLPTNRTVPKPDPEKRITTVRRRNVNTLGHASSSPLRATESNRRTVTRRSSDVTRTVPGRSQPSQPILVHAVTVIGTPAVKVSGTSTAGSVGRSAPITDGASFQSCWKMAHAATEVHRTMSRIRGRDGGLANDIMKMIASPRFYDWVVVSCGMGRLGIEPRTYCYGECVALNTAGVVAAQKGWSGSTDTSPQFPGAIHC